MEYPKTRKTINYDLNWKGLKEKYGTSDAIDVYTDLIDYLQSCGFEKTGESSFTSKTEISQPKVVKIISNIHKKVPNSSGFVKNLHLAYVKEQIYDFKNALNTNQTSKILKDAETLLEFGLNINPETSAKRSISFDISEEVFESKNPDLDYNEAYSKIKTFLEKKGYKRIQNSVYISEKEKTNTETISDMLSLSETFHEYGKAMSKILVGTLEKIDDYTDTANFGNAKAKKNALKYSKEKASEASDHKPLTLAEAKRMKEEKELQEWKEKNHKAVDKHKDTSDDLTL